MTHHQQQIVRRLKDGATLEFIPQYSRKCCYLVYASRVHYVTIKTIDALLDEGIITLEAIVDRYSLDTNPLDTNPLDEILLQISLGSLADTRFIFRYKLNDKIEE